MNLKTIAQKAGVSTATVSNVINGNHRKVSQQTIDRVLKIIEENDYKPNATARSLASKKSRIIGVVVPNLAEDENFFMSPHAAHLLALLENDIRGRGYYMMMRCVTQCKEIVPLFSSWNVDGMIFFGTFKEEIEDIRRNVDVPAVFIDAYADELDITSIGVDDYGGGRLMGEYLLERGHRRIAFVGPEVDTPGVVRQRFLGLCDACEEYAVTIPEECRFSARTYYRSGVEAGKRIAASGIPFTAVAVMADIVAFGVMEGLKQSGLRVPEDVSVIGFDNLPECDLTSPKLTTVAQDTEALARRVGECLFEMIREEKSMPLNQRDPVEIVERASVKNLKLE